MIGLLTYRSLQIKMEQRFVAFLRRRIKSQLSGLIFLLTLMLNTSLVAQEKVSLNNRNVELQWKKSEQGYQLIEAGVRVNGRLKKFENPQGAYTVLYSRERPDTTHNLSLEDQKLLAFPGKQYKYIAQTWKEALRPVPMNTAGTAIHFYPETAAKESSARIVFSHEEPEASIRASWSLDPAYPNDVMVKIQITAKQSGFYSIQTPTLATVLEKELAWGTVPGYFQGAELQHDLILSYAYGHGIPDRPVVLRERTGSTLSPLITNKNGLTLGVIPDPGTGRDPWITNKNAHRDWNLGLSLMNRRGELSPTSYHPVLGENDSYLEKGEQCSFGFRFTIENAGWYEVFKHAVYDVYKFKDQLAIKDSKVSLTNRLLNMTKYLQNDTTSKWSVMNFNGLKIGAQAYFGGVVGSDRDATKNADYGAMWMLANITGDTILRSTRLPYARNFKLAQQQNEEGFFKGAALGQYYLWKSGRFVEEWGDYVEPIALTYYTIVDMGNILLFSPDDEELRGRLRIGAEKLLSWQYPDGHWEVAYNRKTEAPVFSDIKDLRPTFYGLLVAHKILGDRKYLEAAKKGADWFIKNAVEKGRFLGVCGDARFVPDFATGQSAQALLDLFEVTKEDRYQRAAINVARIYTTSVYTHPVVDRGLKFVNGTQRKGWEISQVGLSFEHGGTLGSANLDGPILLASHAGLFLRISQLTGDPLFADMARAAAWGRDAFVDSKTSVASYYWRAMNSGPGAFPHHAWWQVGWITDYLLSEIAFRSGNRICFPRGFITPKVGPHQSYGFAPGTVYGKQASLYLPDGLFTIDNPRIDYVCAINSRSKELYLFLLNNDDDKQELTVRLHNDKFSTISKSVRKVSFIEQAGTVLDDKLDLRKFTTSLPEYGLGVIKIKYE